MNHSSSELSTLHFPGDRWQLVQWGIDTAQANGVNLSSFKSFLVVQNWGVDHGFAGNGVVIVHKYAFPTLIEYGFICHEMGHGFGFPHSWSANPDTEYGDGWDIMSWDTATSSTSDYAISFESASGTAGPGLNARNVEALGAVPPGGTWTPSEPDFNATITLHALNQPYGGGGYVVAEIPPNATTPPRASNSRFTVEFRHKDGLDQGIPTDTVLIHEIRTNGLSYLQPSWGGQFVAGQQFVTPDPKVFVQVMSIDPSSATATVQITYTIPDGTLLQASGAEVDRMEGGRRRWIPDPATFNCMGLDWNAIQHISDSEWQQIPQGVPYPSRTDNALLQGSGPEVYVMAGCQRHWIPDPETFNAHGYDWNAIQHVADADLNAIPSGAPLPPVGNSAAFISQSVPSWMNDDVTVAVTMRNTGDTTWTAGGNNPYRLGSQNPQDNTTWGLNRVDVPATVPPGGQVTFSFTISPSTLGTHNFQWRMVQEGITWFGDYTPDVHIRVVKGP